MSEAKQFVTLPIETVNSVLQYLASRPYAEVAEVITKLQSEAQVTESEVDVPELEAVDAE